MDMIHVEVSDIFRFPPRAAFAFITNVMNWSRYWPSFVRIEHDGEPRWSIPGDRITVVQRFLGRETALHLQLEEFRPDLIRYRSQQTGLPDLTHERHFVTLADGFEYRLVVAYAPRKGWRGLFDRVVFKRGVERAMRQTVRNLRSQFHQLDEGLAMPSSSSPKTMPRKRGVLLAFLLGIAVSSPVQLQATSVTWIPSWARAAVSVAALLGVLCVFWSSGALRGVLLASFIGALTLAALTGWLLTSGT